MTEQLDWTEFIKEYKKSSYATQVALIRTHLSWFDTRCGWIACAVWGEALSTT
ncbi:MAG: hypothetical protein RLZZ76_253 [Candidatus Parcubacteria bacterium]|jgi:hypothetical protein